MPDHISACISCDENAEFNVGNSAYEPTSDETSLSIGCIGVHDPSKLAGRGSQYTVPSQNEDALTHNEMAFVVGSGKKVSA